MRNSNDKPAYLNDEAIEKFIAQALAEDVGEGDHSSCAVIAAEASGKAALYAKDEGILAGITLAEMIFQFIDDALELRCHFKEGEKITYGDCILEVEGNLRAILKGERLVLNCMQRMSGIATLTHKAVELLSGSKTRILDTRKTTPNFRMMEKWAVHIGGGKNHRMGLYDMIMLKDNHIDYAGGIEKALAAAADYRKKMGKKLLIEVETRTLDEVKAALATQKADVIMCDNMSLQMIKKAVSLVGGQAKTEVSGGVTLEMLAQIADCEPDYVSMGALTYGATPLDLSLKAKITST